MLVNAQNNAILITNDFIVKTSVEHNIAIYYIIAIYRYMSRFELNSTCNDNDVISGYIEPI